MKKIDAAREQLLTALDLYLHDKSPVSVHSLAGNARELIEINVRVENKIPFIEHIVKQTGKTHSDVYRLMNQHRNAFKHDRINDQELLENFNDEMNDALLSVVISDYLVLRGKGTIEMQVFQAWYLASNFSTIAPEAQGEYIYLVDVFKPFFGLSRKAQKRGLLQMIENAKLDAELMADKATEASLHVRPR